MLSNPLEISHGLRIVRIGMPPDWDAAPLTFQISPTITPIGTCTMPSVTGEWVPYEVTVPSVVPNSILFLPPDAGSTSAGSRSAPAPVRSPSIRRPIARSRSCSTKQGSVG